MTIVRIVEMSPVVQCSPIGTGKSMSDRRNCVKSTSKSLNSLRQLLQKSINEEIDDIMQKYIKQYLEPAAENIENNQKIGVVPTNGMPPKQHIKAVCRQILDEAKKMY